MRKGWGEAGVNLCGFWGGFWGLPTGAIGSPVQYVGKPLGFTASCQRVLRSPNFNSISVTGCFILFFHNPYNNVLLKLTS